MTREELLAALEAATGPDRELDRCISLLSDGKNPDEYVLVGATAHLIPQYTASIDAALLLVPEGWHWAVYTDKMICGKNGVRVVIGGPDRTRRGWSKIIHETYAATPALALCIAALKARTGPE